MLPTELDSLVFYQLTDTLAVATVENNSGNYFELLLTTLAVFVGAGLAFASEHYFRYRQERKERHKSLSFSQFALYLQANSLMNAQPEFSSYSDEDQFAWIKTRRFFFRPALVQADLDGLAFILQAKDKQNPNDPNILQDVFLAQENYHLAVDLINTRNEAYREMQTRMAELEKTQQQFTPEAIGLELIGDLSTIGNSLHKELPNVIEKLNKARGQLESFAKRNGYALSSAIWKEKN